MKQTIADIKQRLAKADEEQFAVLERALAADTRKGVVQALAATRRRLDALAAERARIQRLYAFQQEAAFGVASRRADGQALEPGDWVTAVGLDEVGRGPLAGPLTIGAVVLPANPQIMGLNDSKQLSPERRAALSREIKETAVAWHIEHIPPADIDEFGMSACLHKAFSQAVAAIDEKMAQYAAEDAAPGACQAAGSQAVRAVLIDGNPLNIDEREVNFVKGDARVAAISAASIIAKVARDDLMVQYAQEYPEYGFDSNKGYGSAEHIAAIGRVGLSPIHRASFCQNFSQGTLF